MLDGWCIGYSSRYTGRRFFQGADVNVSGISSVDLTRGGEPVSAALVDSNKSIVGRISFAVSDERACGSQFDPVQ